MRHGTRLSELLKRFVAANVGRRVHFPFQTCRKTFAQNVLTTYLFADAHIRRDLALVFRKEKPSAGRPWHSLT